MRRALLVFVDGVGMGRPGACNPFDGAPVEILAPLARAEAAKRPDVVCIPLDATLGHAGLPQSATGQATIFTGEDAMRVAGGHREGYPTRAVAELVTRASMLRRARDAGKRAGFLNAFDAPRAARIAAMAADGVTRREGRRRLRPSASALCALAGGGSLRTFEDARAGRAATFDLTGEVCRAFGLDAPRRSIRGAARAVADGAAELDLALFEMFLTDKAGHAQDMTWARVEIVRLERFLEELFAAVDPHRQLVVVTSDHGNLEDLSTRTHTLAKVPLLAFGAGAGAFAAGAGSLLDLAPRLLEAIQEED
jgi:2,3-bisphosphoglycerate-independent phosphoglycerate mutase